MNYIKPIKFQLTDILSFIKFAIISILCFICIVSILHSSFHFYDTEVQDEYDVMSIALEYQNTGKFKIDNTYEINIDEKILTISKPTFQARVFLDNSNNVLDVKYNKVKKPVLLNILFILFLLEIIIIAIYKIYTIVQERKKDILTNTEDDNSISNAITKANDI